MGFLNFAIKRAIPALGTAGVASWASITTANDDWDDYNYLLPSSAANAATAGSKKERIVILGSGWSALSALRKCAAPTRTLSS